MERTSHFGALRNQAIVAVSIELVDVECLQKSIPSGGSVQGLFTGASLSAIMPPILSKDENSCIHAFQLRLSTKRFCCYFQFQDGNSTLEFLI